MGKKIAAAFTFSRLPIGLGVALCLYWGQFTFGFGLYVLGLVTDVLDGFIARATGSASDWGGEWDRRMDIVFNATSTAGYVLGAYFVWGNLAWAFVPFVSMAGLVVVTRPFFQPHSAASKLRSGVIRCLLIGFVAARLNWTSLDVVLVVVFAIIAIPAALHELKLTREEVCMGKRRWFKSPLKQS
jgi:phosphatidylglycerophosphate synthase